jgi:hypothetical protein
MRLGFASGRLRIGLLRIGLRIGMRMSEMSEKPSNGSDECMRIRAIRAAIDKNNRKIAGPLLPWQPWQPLQPLLPLLPVAWNGYIMAM